MPGDPHVSGVVPVTEPNQTPVAARPPVRMRRDDTPPTPMPVRGKPARQDEQRWTPSLIAVASLVVVALVTALALLVGLNRGDRPDDLPVVTDPATDAGGDAETDADSEDPPAGDAPAVQAIDPADARIVTVQAFDPFGDNGRENDAQANLAIADGSDSTTWATECYQDRFMGAKPGVGIIVGLSGPAAGTLSVDAVNAPYQVEVLAATGETPPLDFDAWQSTGDTKFADAPGTLEFSVDTPANFLLVWLKELGRDEACTEANPYRGRLGEIAFGP